MPQPVIGHPSSAPAVVLFSIHAPFRLLWRRRYVIAAIMVAIAVLMGHSALTGQGTYTAKLTVASIGKTDTSVLNQLTPVGVRQRFGGNEDREFSEFQTILRSFALAERVERKYGLIRVLFAGLWNAKEGRWEPPVGWRQDLSVMLNRLRGRPDWLPPDIHDLAENFTMQVKLEQSKHSKSVYEISYTRPEREQAVYVLAKLYAEAEIMLREERLRRTQEQVAYLREKITSTNIPEYRQALTDILAEQEKQLMLLASDLPVATAVLDPPNAPVEPKFPNIFVGAALGTVLGLILGIIAVWIGGIVHFGIGALRDAKHEVPRAA